MATIHGPAELKRSFLSSPKYAVIGASKDPSKYGTKVLNWYLTRGKDVVPIHPRENELEDIRALRNVSDLPSPAQTSVSVITPPKATLGILQQAKDLPIRAFWLQPGAQDESVLKYIKDHGLADKVIYGGPCVMLEGDDVIKSLR